MSEPTDLYAAIKRANQYRHEATERPADEAVLNFLAELALAGMRDEDHG